MKLYFQNWEKIQPRKDYKHPWWFAMKNDFHLDPKVQNFSLSERFIVVALLCECSRRAEQGQLEVNLSTLSRQIGCRQSLIKSTIEKLFLYGICTDFPLEKRREDKEEKRKEKKEDLEKLSYEKEKLDFVNQVRKESGLGPLNMGPGRKGETNV